MQNQIRSTRSQIIGNQNQIQSNQIQYISNQNKINVYQN